MIICFKTCGATVDWSWWQFEKCNESEGEDPNQGYKHETIKHVTSIGKNRQNNQTKECH